MNAANEPFERTGSVLQTDTNSSFCPMNIPVSPSVHPFNDCASSFLGDRPNRESTGSYVAGGLGSLLAA